MDTEARRRAERERLDRIITADRLYIAAEASTAAARAARDDEIRDALAFGLTRVAVARAIREANGRGSESGVRWAALRRSPDGARAG